MFNSSMYNSVRYNSAMLFIVRYLPAVGISIILNQISNIDAYIQSDDNDIQIMETSSDIEINSLDNNTVNIENNNEIIIL